MSNLNILKKRIDILEVGNPSCVFRINIDVLNEAFGIGRGMYAKAIYPDAKGKWIPGVNTNEKYHIWMPKMYGNSSGWKNVITVDGKQIHEYIEYFEDDVDVEDFMESEDAYDEGYGTKTGSRLTFIKESPSAPYKFVGVFKTLKAEHCNHIYERVATKVQVIGNPVTGIKIIE